MTRIRLSTDPSHKLDGYHLGDRTDVRRAALLHAMMSRPTTAGALAVQRRVGVLAIFFKNSKPAWAARAKSDARFVAAVRSTMM